MKIISYAKFKKDNKIGKGTPFIILGNYGYRMIVDVEYEPNEGKTPKELALEVAKSCKLNHIIYRVIARTWGARWIEYWRLEN